MISAYLCCWRIAVERTELTFTRLAILYIIKHLLDCPYLSYVVLLDDGACVCYANIVKSYIVGGRR